MSDVSFINSNLFAWIVMPILIFCARIMDVSIGTIRIVFISKGERFLAPLLGFFEVLIWLVALGQIFKRLDHFYYYVAYAGGFAMGNYIGMRIESRLALGYQVIRIITSNSIEKLTARFKASGHGVTVLDGQGSTGPVKILFSVTRRKSLPEITRIINETNPEAFFTLENVQLAQKPILPGMSKNYWLMFKMDRKRK